VVTRLVIWYRAVATLVVSTLLLLVLLDLLAGFALSAWPSTAEESMRRSPYFADRPWAAEYWREFALADRMRYEPYVIWRLPPFAGKLITIDDAGLRVTPGACGGFRVWTFGGSTMWGMGSPNDSTIPAYLARLLPDACVTNFGEVGFASSQSLIQLQSELRQGRRPHLVIFYDGVNDTIATLAYQRPGIHMGWPEIATRFNAPATSLVTSTSLYTLIQRLTARAGAVVDPPDSVVDLTVSSYLGNVDLVQALGRAYGFRAVFFWQPIDKPAPEVARFFQRVQQRLFERAPEGVHDLTQLPGLAYLDWCHTTPESNARIAQAIAGVVLR
jgi:hypothetical protein